MLLKLGLGLPPAGGPTVRSGTIPPVTPPGGGGGGGTGGFEGHETPPTVQVVEDTVVIHGKTKAGFVGRIVVPLGALIADRIYNVNVVADLSQMALDGAKAGIGFGFKSGNRFRLELLQGNAGTTRLATVTGSPPNGWNKNTGHTVTAHGAPQNGTQYAMDIQLAINGDGDAYDFSTSGDDQASWDPELTDQPFTPLTNIPDVESGAAIAAYFASDDFGTYTITVTWVEAEAGILDGTSPTGAFSLSRKLLSAHSGALYTDTGGAITAVVDQAGVGNITAPTAAERPTLSTAGSNSRACADFNGTTNYLNSAQVRFSASSKYVVVSFIPDTITGTGVIVSSFLNPSFYIGTTDVFGPDQILGQNHDGNNDNPVTAATEDTTYVASLRHNGTTLFLRVNNGTEVTIASGASTANGAFGWGAHDALFGLFHDGPIFESATWDTQPDLATRNAIEQNFMAWVGA